MIRYTSCYAVVLKGPRAILARKPTLNVAGKYTWGSILTSDTESQFLPHLKSCVPFNAPPTKLSGPVPGPRLTRVGGILAEILWGHACPGVSSAGYKV